LDGMGLLPICLRISDLSTSKNINKTKEINLLGEDI